MKVKEIASKITEHLKEWENDPTINVPIKHANSSMSLRRFFNAAAFPKGNYIGISYVSYQGVFTIKKEEAVRYLGWIEEGNVGTISEFLSH